MTKTNRIYGLDLLRAIAILSVIYSHSFFLVVDHINERAYTFFSLDGVTLFFVLSGFLIGGILLKTISGTSFTSLDLLGFWIRRWFRTLPNYFFILILLIFLAVIMGKPLPSNLFSYFFFCQNFASPHPAFFPEAWSLSVEEWFYLLIPAGLFFSIKFFGKSKERAILWWVVITILAVTLLRIIRAVHYHFPDFESWDNYQRKLVITRLDSIMYGFLGAWLSFYRKEAWLRHKKLLFASGLILLFYPRVHETLFGQDLFFNNYFSLSITSLATLLMLPALSQLRSGKGIIYRFLTFVSIVSYSMYLVNFSLIQLTIIPSLSRSIVIFTTNQLIISIFRYTIYWVFTFAFAYLLYTFFEKPMMELRERFGKQQKSAKA